MKPLNVDIILKNTSHVSKTSIIPIVKLYLEHIKAKGNSVITAFDNAEHPILHSEVRAIIVGETDEIINFSQWPLIWHVYTLDLHGPVQEIDEDEEGGAVDFATHLVLPSVSLFNLWENLYYDTNIKENLLKYAKTMMEFSDKGVDTNVVNCNRVILLHGPPGTGKTSLCKALAQKLAIRMQDRYNSGILIEINSHSLFSKWFSESGKLVTKMFNKIREIVHNPNLLVCVLIDEVESLAHARNQCMSGNEPSDSIRVVNALLTQIDQIKRYSNVLVLTTSNLCESIDLAFIDRADIKQYLGLPTLTAIYKVYYSCIEELVKAQIIMQVDQDLAPPNELKNIEDFSKLSAKLLALCKSSEGLSGRSLRKIPFVAHALFLEQSLVDLDLFLDAMAKAIDWEKAERKRFT